MVMHPHTKYHWPISKETITWPWGQRSRSKQRSFWYATHLLCTHIPNIIDLSRKTKNVMAQTRIYYLKNNYLTFRSKVKVQQRSLWYATHHLMDMHPHTKYHWPISKDIFLLYYWNVSYSSKYKFKINFMQNWTHFHCSLYLKWIFDISYRVVVLEVRISSAHRFFFFFIFFSQIKIKWYIGF